MLVVEISCGIKVGVVILSGVASNRTGMVKITPHFELTIKRTPETKTRQIT